ncbi:MAG: hypothetical protein CL608_15360 [Anaerolineaceae bacterium]|nr:hypothetical protein [Anaerolineaceae bacterium]
MAEFSRDPISIARLLLDLENPRFPEIQPNQPSAIQAMIQDQKEKLINLAEHITRHGVNPAIISIVMESDTDSNAYTVLDGNRRLAAIKLLMNPSLGKEVFSQQQIRRLQSLATQYIENPINGLRCVIVKDRDEADIWIPLIHRGQREGAGQVSWDGQVAARYDARRGKRSFALQVLDFVQENASLSEEAMSRIEAGKFPITNLERSPPDRHMRKIGGSFS